MLRYGCAAIVILIIAIPIIAGRFLPWYGTIAVIAAEVLFLIVGGPKLIAWGIARLAIGLFMTKSRVLRGATVEVHEIAPTHQPVRRADASLLGDQTDADEDADDPQPTKPSHYVRIDFTLTPKPGQSKMTHYEPGEMMLMPFSDQVSMEEDPTADDRSAHAEDVKIYSPDGIEIEIDKVSGPTRLVITFACPPVLRGRAKFRYYFESFGDLVIP